MCGIVGYTGARSGLEVLMNGLSKLEYRGYDSAGVAFFTEHGVNVVKTKGRLSCLSQLLESNGNPDTRCGIGHTRWATHGEPSEVNSHPHSGGRVVAVHNGIIENYMDIKEHLSARGYLFESQTDTETLVKLLDYHYAGDPVKAILDAAAQIEGSYALAIMFIDRPGEIYAIRRESPLIVGLGEGENFVASDIPALLQYTREYILLEAGEVAKVTPDSVEIVSSLGEPVTHEVQHATWDVEAAEKGGYPHFMLKEIHEQPTALNNTVLARVKGSLPVLEIEGLDERLSSVERIRIIGCGTAMHAGLVGASAIERLARVPASVEIASEYRYKNPIPGDNELTIVISQSGETADSLAAMRLAKSLGSYTLAVANVVGSSIAREADAVLYTWAGPEIAVASTKAYSVQLAALMLIAIRLAYLKGKLDEQAAKKLTNELAGLSAKVCAVLENTDDVKLAASRCMNAEDIFYIGRGLDYALAMEGSLKLKEISYVHSEAYAAGELKHGAIALIEQGTPVLALLTQPELVPKMISNIREVRSRGAKVVAFAPKSAKLPNDCAETVIELPEGDPLLMPVLAIPMLQLFSYYVAVLRGCDVDKPRNLAKSVTVE